MVSNHLNFQEKSTLILFQDLKIFRDNLDNLKIIDARSTGEYDGSTVRAAQSGHIPNAINIDWNQNISEDGTFKNDEELSKMYDYPKDSEIVTYCQGAYRAANSFLSFEKTWDSKMFEFILVLGENGVTNLNLPVEK